MLAAASARTMPNADEVDALELEAGALERRRRARSTISRRTATTTTRERRPTGVSDDAERLEVEDGLVHRHRDVVGRLRP